MSNVGSFVMGNSQKSNGPYLKNMGGLELLHASANSKYFSSGAEFSPTDIPGLMSWFDASDAATITSSGGLVSQWNDKSGNGYHVTQGTDAAKPVTGTRTQNGLNVLDFIPNDRLNGSNAVEARTVIVAGAYDAAGGGVFYGSSQADNRYALFNESATNLYSGTSAGFLLSTTGNTTAFRIYVALLTSPGKHVVDGTDQTMSVTTGAVLTGNVILGDRQNGGAPLNGVIGELLVFDTILSEANLDILGLYLGAKWGTTWS